MMLDVWRKTHLTHNLQDSSLCTWWWCFIFCSILTTPWLTGPLRSLSLTAHLLHRSDHIAKHALSLLLLHHFFHSFDKWCNVVKMTAAMPQQCSWHLHSVSLGLTLHCMAMVISWAPLFKSSFTHRFSTVPNCAYQNHCLIRPVQQYRKHSW